MSDPTDFSPLLFVISPILFLIVFFILIWVLLRRLRPKQEYGVKSVTLRGETVKSIAERRIADYLEKNNIKYVYEHKPRGRFLYGLPDFYLPHYDVYVEYWGLVNADDKRKRKEYERNMRRKMAIYHENNIKFISIYPDNLENLDWIFRTKFKKVTGFELPN